MVPNGENNGNAMCKGHYVGIKSMEVIMMTSMQMIITLIMIMLIGIIVMMMMLGNIT